MYWLLLPAALVVGPIIIAYLFRFYQRIQGNFHVVVPGVLYRSSELRPALAKRYAGKYGLRSLLRLRGANGQAEAQAAELGLEFHSVNLRASRYEPPERLAEYLELLRSMPKPALVCCKGGSDRSGLLAALWLYEVEGIPPSQAIKQLCLLKGHLPWYRGRWRMRQSFWDYVKYREKAQADLKKP